MDAELQQRESYEVHEYDGDLGDAADAILDHSFKFSGLPYLYKKIMVLGVLLEWTYEDIKLNERAIPYAITQLRTSSHSQAQLCALASARLSCATKSFIKKVLNTSHTTNFFPPIRHNLLSAFYRRIELAASLRNLELWRYFPANSPDETFRNELQHIIHEETNAWITQVDDLSTSVSSLGNSLYFSADPYISFFYQFDICYIKVIFATLDQKLPKKGKRFIRLALHKLNTHDDESLELFTKETMKLFEGFKTIAKMAKESRVEEGELFHYETWFTGCVIFWTYTWRTMCRQLTLRALEQDNEELDDERVLPSCVNFLAIHKALYEDFVNLELKQSNTALMCVLKIALTVTDDLLIYVKRMRTAYHKFDFTKRMIAANSIQHICNFLRSTTPRLLNIDAVLTVLPQIESQQAKSTLNQIFLNAIEQATNVSTWIVTSLCQERSEAILKHCQSITQCTTKRRRKNLGWLRAMLSLEPIDHLLTYLDRLSAQLNSTFFPSLSKSAHHQLLEICERSILESMLKGQSPSYYRQIQIDCEMARRLLQVQGTHLSPILNNMLYLNASSTEQLILQYYTQLADRCDENYSMEASTANVRLRVGYIQTTNERVIVRIDVLSAANLANVDERNKFYKVYCRVEVLPHLLFPLPQFQAQNTAIKKQHTLNPIWDEHFQLTMSEECFYTNGSVLCLSTLQYGLHGYYDLVGQAYVQLSRVPKLASFSRKHRPPIMRLPLLLPEKEQFVGPFQVLVERSSKDDTARAMCDYERYLHDYHMLPAYVDKNNSRSALRSRSSFRQLMHKHLI